MLAKFADVEMEIKISGAHPNQAAVPVQSGVGNSPISTESANAGHFTTLGGSSETQIASKPAALTHDQAKWASHPTQPPSAPTPENLPAKVTDLEVASALGLAPSAAGAKSTQSADTNPGVSAPSTAAEGGDTPPTHGEQAVNAPILISGGSATDTNLSHQPPSSGANSGQDSEPSAGGIPTAMKPMPVQAANNPGFSSAINLLTAHAPAGALTQTQTTTAPATQAASQPPATLSAWQNYEGGPSKIVTSASLSGSAEGAEMHVELRSATLGPLQVHTVVNQGSVGAEIHVEGREAHTILTAGLPALESALGERNLRVGNLAVYQDHMGGGMTGGEKQNPQPGSSPPPQPQALRWDTPSQTDSFGDSTLDMEETTNPAVGLSVHA